MDPSTAYQFLKPSLDQFSEKEMEELRKLINGEPKPKKKVKVKQDPIPTVAEYKRKLLRSNLFKNRKATRQSGF